MVLDCAVVVSRACRTIFQKVVQLTNAMAEHTDEHQYLWDGGADVLPSSILLDHILYYLHPLMFPPAIVWTITAVLREELTDILQRVLDFGHLRTHGVVQGRQVDGVAPVVIDRDARRKVLNLRHSKRVALHWPVNDMDAPDDTNHSVWCRMSKCSGAPRKYPTHTNIVSPSFCSSTIGLA